LSALEKSLEATLGACEVPPESGNRGLEFDIDAQSDLLTVALACGQTTIGSLQVRIADNDGSLYPWVGLDTAGHHTLSHDSSAEASAIRADVYRWYAGRFAHLLDRLAAIPEADGSRLLDHTMVIWGTELGTGWTHEIDNIPFVVAGGGARGLRVGRYLRPTGMTHNRLLVSAARFMGIPDLDQFGSSDTGSGPLPGLLG
jgi:hypothetical protein